MNGRGYTLLELLAAMAALGVILLMLLSTTGMATLAWKENASSIDSFQQARAAFSTVTRRLSQATLNSYRDYYDVSAKNFTYPNLVPAQVEYRYRSELHFISGAAVDLIPPTVPGTERPTHAVFFQAPLGYSSKQNAPLRSLLNACGYYVEYGTDDPSRPDFVSARSAPRYRLYEMLQPSEDLSIYRYSILSGAAWLKRMNADSLAANSHVLAENIVALILLPQRRVDDSGIAPRYAYDSRAWQSGRTTLGELTQNQLPPLVQVTMVVVDEASARKQQEGGDRLKGLIDPALFQDAALYNRDMEQLQGKLKENFRYRCFQTTVSLAASTWSEQTP